MVRVGVASFQNVNSFALRIIVKRCRSDENQYTLQREKNQSVVDAGDVKSGKDGMMDGRLTRSAFNQVVGIVYAGNVESDP